MDVIYERYPRIKTFSDNVEEESKQSKSVTSHFGRKQFVPRFFSELIYNRMRAAKSCVNRKIQGTAADIQKMGLINTTLAIKNAISDGNIAGLYDKSQAKMVANVHDSQIWSIDRRIRPQDIVPVLSNAMSTPESINFPRIRVDVKLGLNWADLSDYDPRNDYSLDYWDMVENNQEPNPDYTADNGVIESDKVEHFVVLDLSNVDNIERAMTDLISLSVFGQQVTKLDVRVNSESKQITSSMAPYDLQDIMSVRCPEAVVTIVN